MAGGASILGGWVLGAWAATSTAGAMLAPALGAYGTYNVLAEASSIIGDVVTDNWDRLDAVSRYEQIGTLGASLLGGFYGGASGRMHALRGKYILDPMTQFLASGYAPNAQPQQASRGIRGLVEWWYRGSEMDPYWRSLPLFKKFLYELGQKTLGGKQFKDSKLANIIDPVVKGLELARFFSWPKNWPRIGTATGFARATLTLSSSRKAWGQTLPEGPTPGARFTAPVLLMSPYGYPVVRSLYEAE